MFIHLRAYSDYSFGESNLKLKKIITKSYDEQMPAICISDSNMFGALEFAIAGAANGIQPIIGYSVDLEISDHIGEVLLIAKSEIGYKNLLKVATRVCVDKQSDVQPAVELDFLSQYSEDLIGLFGGVNDKQLLSVEKLGSDRTKQTFQSVIQKTKLEPFIELTRYSDDSHIQSEAVLINLAYELDIPLVATNPINFLNHKTYEAAEALHCIINNRFVSQEDRSKINPDHYFKSREEMIELFKDIPEAIENTVLIAKKCHFFPTKQPIKIPKYDPNLDANEVLEDMATNGLNERISQLEIDRDAYFARLRFELDLIQKMNFSDYFLIVSDFIQWSKKNGIAVGPGRGSGAGSIVAWAIKITELDPIEHGLLFERFLNPERVSMPDFDIDFCQLRREEVLKYIVRKYGADKIAHIITFGKLQPRAVLRDVGRVLQMPYGQVDRICKMIPQNQANPVTLQQAIDLDKQLQKMREEDMTVDRLLKIGLELEGCHRNISTHAAGLVIAQQPIVEVMPLYRDGGSLSGQFSMKYVEAAGLIKFDFLGLKTLTVISNTQELVKSSMGEDLDIYAIPDDDPKTYTMLSEGNVLGVFQLEGSAGIREAVKQMKPDKLGDIIALTSLYRPGPMENIPTYVARKHGTQVVDVLHPDLKEVLSETYGIIVYQEQVIKIAQILAGYSLGEADILRRAMGKKDKVEMQQQRAIFVGRSLDRGLDEGRAEEIFDLVNKFASYGFNKAHAAAYAVVTYQTAYLRCHYLTEFLVASINLEINSQEKVSAFCDEAKQNGVEVAKPSINNSMVFFSIEVLHESDEIIGVITHDLTEMKVNSTLSSEVIKINRKRIRYGLAGVKGTGVKALSEIIAERDKNGKFKSLDDFLGRTAAKGFNKRLFEQLVRSGAIDELYDNGNELLQNIDKINNYVASISRSKIEEIKQISLFDLMAQEDDKGIITQLTPHGYWSKADKLQMEHKALGFYLTEHPVLLYKDILKKYGLMFSTEVNSYKAQESKEINIAGVVKECKIRSGKGEKAGKYAFLEVVDPYGLIDISIFDSNILNKQIKLLDSGQLVFCTATIRNDAQGQRILLRNIKPLMEAVEEAIPYFKISISTIKAAEMVHEKLSNELKKDDRTIKIKIVAVCQDGSEVEFYSDQSLTVTHSFISDMIDQEGITTESR